MTSTKILTQKPTMLPKAFGDVDLATFPQNNNQGFKVLGAAQGDSSGVSVSSDADVNGDGYDNIIIAAQGADPFGRTDADIVYVLYGAESRSKTDSLTRMSTSSHTFAPSNNPTYTPTTSPSPKPSVVPTTLNKSTK